MTGFEVKNEEVEALLKKMGRLIQKFMPKGWGFTLFIFDYSKNGKNRKGDDEGSVFYISSAQRKDMLKALMEFIDKQNEDQPIN